MHGTCLYGASLELMTLIAWFHKHSIETCILKPYLVDCNVNYFEGNFAKKKKTRIYVTSQLNKKVIHIYNMFIEKESAILRNIIYVHVCVKVRMFYTC